MSNTLFIVGGIWICLSVMGLFGSVLLARLGVVPADIPAKMLSLVFGGLVAWTLISLISSTR